MPGLVVLYIHWIYHFSSDRQIGGPDIIAKTAQWGNSIGVRIPKELGRGLESGVDSTVEIGETDDGIVIKPVGRKEYSLKELVKGLTRQNWHDEVDFGRPIGKEIL